MALQSRPVLLTRRPHMPLRVRASSAAEGATVRGYAVTLRKPLGLVLEEKPSGEVYVAELVPGGNAAKAGAIQPGDLLRRCSATTLKGDKSGSDVGHGEYLYNNWSRTMIDCKGLAFDTVMAAIASNNERWGIFDVDLELERPSV